MRVFLSFLSARTVEHDDSDDDGHDRYVHAHPRLPASLTRHRRSCRDNSRSHAGFFAPCRANHADRASLSRIRRRYATNREVAPTPIHNARSSL